MCTWVTIQTELSGSGKGPEGEWMEITDASVYFDHPQHSTRPHALLVDLTDRSKGPAGRLALELDTQSALRLIEAMQAAMAAVDEAVLADS